MKQTKTILYDPSIGSLNMGDHIISEAVRKQLGFILEGSFISEISTHLPVSKYYLKLFEGFDYRFVCGSNLLRGKMNRIFRPWDINIFNARNVGPAILVGAGWQSYEDSNLYTKIVYNSVLSDKFMHSVRDSFTESKLKQLGITNVLNTSCATMWDLTPEHCLEIPMRKATNVITTITDYRKNHVLDEKMFEILTRNYTNVYLWLQSSEDLNYFNELNVSKNRIHIVNSSLDEYDALSEDSDLDFVGTRLHGGIRALQKKKRTIIIAVDNRAIEKKKDFNLVCIHRDEIFKSLETLINSEFKTEIKIPLKEINQWKNQFKHNIDNYFV